MKNSVYPVGMVSLSLASLVYANANIEKIVSGESFYFKEAIYFIGKNKAKNGGYESDGVTVLMNVNELKALSFAMKDLVKNGVSDYEKISNSGTMKKVFLGYSKQNDKDIFYINIKLFGYKPKSVSVGCDKYRFLGFSDSLYNLANETEKLMFLYERKKEKFA